MGHFNQLVLLHKRVTRVIYQDTFDAHTGPIFADLKLLGLDQITCSKSRNSCTYTKAVSSTNIFIIIFHWLTKFIAIIPGVLNPIIFRYVGQISDSFSSGKPKS